MRTFAEKMEELAGYIASAAGVDPEVVEELLFALYREAKDDAVAEYKNLAKVK